MCRRNASSLSFCIISYNFLIKHLRVYVHVTFFSCFRFCNTLVKLCRKKLGHPVCACRYLHSYVSCLVEFYRPDSLRMSRNLACIYHQNVNSINNKYYIFIYKLYKKIYTCLYWNTLYVKVNKQTARIGFIVRVETIRIKCNKEERRLRTFLFFKIFKISLVRKYLVARRKFTKIKSPVLETLNTLRKAL